MRKKRITKYTILFLAVCITVAAAMPAAAAETAPLKEKMHMTWTSLQGRTGTLPASETTISKADEQTPETGEDQPEITQTEEDAQAKAVLEFKSEILRLVNKEREKAGLPALKVMDKLAEMADRRAEESAETFSHTRPDGTRCFTVFSEYSMTYKSAGENLAFGFSSPEATVAAWMDSPSHKANILSEKYIYIGIGYFLKSNGKIYCSQLFYTPTA